MSRSKKRLVLALALASLVVLAGCSGSGGDAADAGYTGQSGGTGLSSGGDDAGSSGGDADAANAFQADQREVIRTGNVSLTVEDFDESRQELTQAVEAHGGFVSDTGQRVHRSGNQSWVSGEIVLRVPQENYSALLERTKAEGEVRESSTNTRDVTDQLVDVEARLDNLRAERDQLRSLYDEANDTEDVLAVQEELSDVQSEIERLEARQQSLQQKVAYSTLTVEMAEERPEPETTETDAWYDTGLLSAFVESIGGVVVVGRSLAVGAAYAAPYVLAFGTPVVAVYGLWRRRRGGSEPVEPMASVAETEPVGETELGAGEETELRTDEQENTEASAETDASRDDGGDASARDE
ncbi:DUF4349 domain-containing protein [Halorussus amylolyticus]|uniref:DUF4349 domain-containing protein n=1 Tax=Halorussus amylolyticus TaxID=1126242 RepID=UPI0010514476|nr:DUF4349 domain-containing protein [Halorussus amylolyticus]